MEKKLELKLGFSAIISLPIPTHEVKVTVNKNTLSLEGFDPAAVGNFATEDLSGDWRTALGVGWKF